MILPPFLTAKPIIPEHSCDPAFITNRPIHQVGNWNDISHELLYYKNTPLLCQTYETLLSNSQWYYPAYQNAPSGSGLYHFTSLLRSHYLSEFSLRDMLMERRIPREELAEMVSVDQYYNLFFTKHLSTFDLFTLSRRFNCHIRPKVSSTIKYITAT